MSDAPRKAVYEVAADQIDRELASNEAIGSRAVALLGFCGVILALAAALASNGLAERLGAVGRPIAVVTLIGGFLAIFAAAALAVAILNPKQRGRTKPEVLRELRDNAETEEAVYDRLSKSAITLYKEQGASNDDRAKSLRRAYAVLALGLMLVTTQAVIVALSSSDEPCTTQRKIQTISRRPMIKGSPMTVVTTSSTACVRATQASTRTTSSRLDQGWRSADSEP